MPCLCVCVGGAEAGTERETDKQRQTDRHGESERVRDMGHREAEIGIYQCDA